MQYNLSHRVQTIKPSATLAFSARVNQLKAEGRDIINFTIGEPDFDTPEFIKDAAYKAMVDGHTKYTPPDGITSLKKAVANKFSHENNLQYDISQIIVSNGSKQSIYNLAQAILNPGDEVIIPAPYWVSYPEIVQLAEAKPVFIDTTIHEHFKFSAEALTKAITPKTRLIMLNSPCNPSGMVYTRNELESIAAVLLKHPQILIASDDIYEHILWSPTPFVNILNVCPELYERTIVLNGVSKAYAMTGWRIGYAAGPKTIIKAMSIIQSQATSNPNSIAQHAAVAALEGDQEFVREMCQSYKKRHELMYNGLSKMTGVECLPAGGTFYSFPSIKTLLEINKRGIRTDSELAEFLLNEAHVALMPGSAFGTKDCLRLSFATSDEQIERGISLLQKAISDITN